MNIGVTSLHRYILLSRVQARWVGVALVCLGFLPLLGLFFRLSWSRPAYQFFPLALVGVVMLGWRAIRQTGLVGGAGSLRLTRLLTLAAGGVCLAANLLWSPWLAYLAFLLGLMAGLWGVGGRALLKAFVPVFLLLLAMLPPPLGGDQILTLWLRSVAVDASSALLDFMHVLHVRDGNTLLLPGKNLLVEEACSGINSFVLCNVAGLFWGLWRRRPLRWLLLSLPVISLFVVLGNVLRITLATVADYYWQVNLLTGWPHESFGLGLLMGYCLLIWSTDHLLLFLTRSDEEPPAEPAAQEVAAPSMRAGLPDEPRSCGPVFGFRFAGVFFAVTGLSFFIAHLFAKGGPALAALPMFPSVPELKLSMPESLAGWQRMSSNVGEQTLVQTLGVHSTVWHFQRNGIEAVVAVDYPLNGFHNVKTCYLGNGWQVASQEELFRPSGREMLHAIRLTLQKTIRHAMVYHSVVDGHGEWLSEQTSLGVKFGDSPSRFAAGYRIQLITGGYAPLSSSAAAVSQDLFFQARQLLVPQMVDQLRKEPGK